MALTKISAGILKDSTITATDLAATGTASSATTLQGNDVWATLASSGVINIAAADPGTGQTSGNTWFLSGLMNFVTDASNLGGVWSSGGNLITKRYGAMGAGSLTAGLTAFGHDNSSALTSTEEYNGNIWSAGGTTGGTRTTVPGDGTQSSAWAGGGGTTPGYDTSETYNGSTWSAANNLLTNRYVSAGLGTATAGLMISGRVDGVQYSITCEEYNGTCWSAAGSMSTGRNELAGCGILSSGLAYGGENPGSTYHQSGEEYNGSAWSAGGTMSSVGRKGAGFAGTSIDGGSIYAGGGNDSGGLGLADEYNGTAWSVIMPLPTDASSKPTRLGSASAGAMVGGYDGDSLDNTQEWNKVTVKFVGV